MYGHSRAVSRKPLAVQQFWLATRLAQRPNRHGKTR
jgi:hypothetical protein